MNIKAELAALEKMTTDELVERYAALTGQLVRTRHRAYLIRKIVWRLQADAEGDLSERARRRAMEIADDAKALAVGVKVLLHQEPGRSLSRPWCNRWCNRCAQLSQAPCCA